MKLQTFREKNKKQMGIIIGIGCIVLLVAGILVYRSFALYHEKKEFNIISGTVPELHDIKYTYYLEDENGEKNIIEMIPEEKSYVVSITCNNASGEWDYEEWGPVISDREGNLTKCDVIFQAKEFNLEDAIKAISPVTTGTGLYKVEHPESEFTVDFSSDLTEGEIINLKQTEYRYAGENPDNYVKFNNELWRVIGLVNTPEGQRVKIIRNESIGEYSWDSSESSVNGGYGVNEWSQADLMTLLNNGPYYNRSSGSCYNGQNNVTTECDFSNTGLTEEAKEMIDTITWNTGSNGDIFYDNINTTTFYNLERSKNTGKICNSGTYCNDTVTRTSTWKGMIGLMYPSDFGYSTSGGIDLERNLCLNTELYNWYDNDDCYQNSWLYKISSQWTLMPATRTGEAYRAFHIFDRGRVYRNRAYVADAVFPTLYLKINIKLVNGNGTFDAPYELNI